MVGDGARVKDWPRERGHHLCLTDTFFFFFFVGGGGVRDSLLASREIILCK